MRLLELADRFGSGAVEAARSRAAPTAPEPNTAVPPRARLVALRTHRWAALPPASVSRDTQCPSTLTTRANITAHAAHTAPRA